MGGGSGRKCLLPHFVCPAPPLSQITTLHIYCADLNKPPFHGLYPCSNIISGGVRCGGSANVCILPKWNLVIPHLVR